MSFKRTRWEKWKNFWSEMLFTTYVIYWKTLKVNIYNIKVRWITYIIKICAFTEDILMLQAATHFLIWFSSSLLPNNKISVEENLNLLVRSFMSLISKDLSVELTDRCFDTLDLLINRNCDLLSESIAVLDDFPTEDRYNNFRLTQEKIKYRHQTNSLWDEINYFLKCSDRGVAGFQNLRKHVSENRFILINNDYN